MGADFFEILYQIHLKCNKHKVETQLPYSHPFDGECLADEAVGNLLSAVL